MGASESSIDDEKYDWQANVDDLMDRPSDEVDWNKFALIHKTESVTIKHVYVLSPAYQTRRQEVVELQGLTVSTKNMTMHDVVNKVVRAVWEGETGNNYSNIWSVHVIFTLSDAPTVFYLFSARSLRYNVLDSIDIQLMMVFLKLNKTEKKVLYKNTNVIKDYLRFISFRKSVQSNFKSESDDNVNKYQ